MLDQTNSNDGWLTADQLSKLGFKSIGENVLISSTCKIYGANNIVIGSNVRIDDFCVLACAKGSLALEGYNHLGSFCYINGGGMVHFKKFAGLSSRCTIYSTSDDYSGDYLTNPTVPPEYTNVLSSPVIIGKHTIIGASSTILPGVSIGDCCSIGAHSLVNKNIDNNKIAVGIPAKIVKERRLGLIGLERDFLSKRGENV